MLSIALWIAQIFAAIVVLLAGSTKLVLSRERLSTRMHWASSWPRERIKLLGVAEIAGALGLVLPVAMGVATFLTPVAALCLAVLMAGAIRTHQRLGENAGGAVVVLVLCLAVAIGRGAAWVH